MWAGFCMYTYMNIDVDCTCFSYQLNAQFLYSVIIYYIIIPDMFPAILCSFSRVQIVFLQHLVSSLSVSIRRVQLLSGLQSALNRCTVRPLTDSDDTRCCKNTI